MVIRNRKVNEETTMLKRLLRLNGITKLPAGSDIDQLKIKWNKRGGFVGKRTVLDMEEQLENAGWRHGTSSSDSSADGSTVGSGTHYISPDGMIEASLDFYYGSTSRDNSYWIMFKFIGQKMNESDEKSFKKLLKMNGVTKLPSGTEFRSDRVSWSKSGGYAGQKTLGKICSQLKDAGWKKGEWRTGGVADGSAVINSNAYTSPDGQLVMTYREHFGATSYDNFYGFTFKLTGNQVNESDDWDGDTPQILKYHSDESISVEDFVDLVERTDQELTDIIIQNSEVYEDVDNPWMMFVDDVCDGKSPEEALGLDYYMNKAARDQLPENISKYVIVNDFDAALWLNSVFERTFSVSKDRFEESSKKMSESSIESEQEPVNEIGEEKVIQTLTQLKTGVPTDHEFYKTPCMMFLNVRFVERWVELDTQEGPWSSKNCQTRRENKGDDLILADLMVWHKNDLHMINTPTRWVWIFGDNTTWDDVCEARGHFTGDEPYGFSEEAKAEMVNKLKGHAITHRCLEAIIPGNMTKRDW